MAVISERYKRLEFILGGLTSATLELNPSNEDIGIIKCDIEGTGYEITREREDKQKNIYHLSIRRRKNA